MLKITNGSVHPKTKPNLSRQERSLKRGTQARRVLHGIPKTAKLRGKTKNTQLSNARYADQITERLTLRELNTVRGNVKRLRYVGEEEVYDINVKGVHAFLANGILVHNCADSYRYFAVEKGGEVDKLEPKDDGAPPDIKPPTENDIWAGVGV